MFKNTASQKLTVFVFDYSTGAPKTGDGANLTCYVSKDDGAVTVLGDTTATELDATNAKGWYSFDLTQAETNADKLVFTGKSTTANVAVQGQLIYTRPPAFPSLVIANGCVDADIERMQGTVVSPAGNIPANVVQISGDTAAADNAELFYEGAFIPGSVDDTSPAAGDFNGNSALSSTDGFYSSAKCVVAFTSGTLRGLCNKVTGYTGATRNLQFSTAWPTAPANTDTFIIIGRIE